MARNIPVGYAYEPRVNVMRLSAYENVNFEEIARSKYIYLLLGNSVDKSVF